MGLNDGPINEHISILFKRNGKARVYHGNNPDTARKIITDGIYSVSGNTLTLPTTGTDMGITIRFNLTGTFVTPTVIAGDWEMGTNGRKGTFRVEEE